MKHKENILRLRAEGKTYNQIKNELNCSKGTIAYHLGEGQKERTKKRTRSQRFIISQFLSNYKEEAGCSDCGGKYPYFVLDFDHRDPDEKEFTLSRWRAKTASLEAIKKEISKCDVVCANCHRYRTQSLFTSDYWQQKSYDNM